MCWPPAKSHTVRRFVELSFSELGVQLDWSGEGVDEIGVCRKSGRVLVRIDPAYFRPTEVDLLIGNPAKAREKLGWRHRIGLPQLCREMVASDLFEAEGGMPRQSEISAFLKEIA